MQVLIRVVIVILAVFLVWILRRWIRRLIFILILLCLAFLIYWLFSPSWAARLWYNVRTFPQRVTSWFSSQTFLDYDSYKLELPTIEWLKESMIENKDDVINRFNDDNGENLEIDKQGGEDLGKWYDFDGGIDDPNNKQEVESQNSGKWIKNMDKIERFPEASIMKFIKIPTIDGKVNNKFLSWYSKGDLLWIIDKYIDENLDDDVDILVTVEYEENDDNPDRIILQTQPKY